MQTHQNVTNHGHVIKQTDILEGTGNALMVDGLLTAAGQIFTIQEETAGSGFVHTGQHIEHGGLTGTVGSNQTIQLFFMDLQVQSLHGLQTAEGNTQVLGS